MPLKAQKTLEERLKEISIDEQPIKAYIDKKRNFYKESYTYNRGEVFNAHLMSEEGIKDTIESMEKEIQKETEKLEVIRNTKTPKEAYFNIIKYPKLQYVPYYVKYARMYILEVCEEFKEEKLTMFRLELSTNSNHIFARVSPKIVSPNWTYDNEALGRELTFFYLSPWSENGTLKLSNFKQSNDLEKELERTTKKLESQLDKIEAYEEKIEKYSKSYFIGKTEKKEMHKLLEGALLAAKLDIPNNYLNQERVLEKIENKVRNEEEEVIKEEFKRIVQLLNDKLGYKTMLEE